MEQSGWENGEGRRLFSNCLGGFILSELGSKKRRHIRIIMASKGIFLVIVLLAKIASIKENSQNTEPEKTVIVNKSLNYERLNMWAEVINI